MSTEQAIEMLECIYPSEKEIKTGEYPDVSPIAEPQEVEHE